MRRVMVKHMADDQPVEQHPQSREMLLHRRLGQLAGQALYIGADMYGLDLAEIP